MLSELDVLIFLKLGDDPERVASRVFGALGSQYASRTSEDYGPQSYSAEGLGFQAVLYPNTGEMRDEEFAEYGFALEITSQFSCVELDPIELEGQLSEYYSRLLAFDLNTETATAIFVEQEEDAEIFERRVYARNTQYRLDSGPTIPKVFVIETRELEVPLTDEEEAEEDEWDDEEEYDEEYETDEEEE